MDESDALPLCGDWLKGASEALLLLSGGKPGRRGRCDLDTDAADTGIYIDGPECPRRRRKVAAG